MVRFLKLEREGTRRQTIALWNFIGYAFEKYALHLAEVTVTDLRRFTPKRNIKHYF